MGKIDGLVAMSLVADHLQEGERTRREVGEQTAEVVSAKAIGTDPEV